MLALKAIDVKNNFKLVCARVFNGETVMLSRPKNQNVVMLSEKEYNELAKAKRNLEYYAMLDESDRQLKAVNVAAEKSPLLEELSISISERLYVPSKFKSLSIDNLDC